ncbi:MAG: PDR/VanB family oxidoreductase [Roseiarcus sp.]|jgi:vanillate O-demethylase ferredoxin subunit
MRAEHVWTDATVRATSALARDVLALEIAPLDGARLWSPGAHIDVSILVGARAEVRSYSLVGEWNPARYRIAVKRQPQGRGGSAYMWSLEPGARLTVGAPNNRFELAHDSPDYLLVAGGIGITPILGMASSLAASGANFRVLYGVRSRADLALADEIGAAVGDRLEIFVSGEGRRIEASAEIARLGAGGELYLCGPLGMIEDFRRAWGASGRPPSAFRVETFGSSGAFAPEPFRVRVRGREIEVAVPRDRSMLDALEAAGVEIVADCRRGECGVCAVDIIDVEGRIDHRDVFLSDHQRRDGRKMCPCVSRASGQIAIDVGRRED